MNPLLDLVIRQPAVALAASEKKVKAFAWARVSTDMQEEKGLSMPEQLREIAAYAEKNDIEIVQTFSEAASAFQKKSRRVEFERMLELARTDTEVSVILVHDLSRFSRDSLEAQILTQELTRLGIRVVSVTDPYIDPESVAGTYMKHILLAKNEAYSREIAFHTKKGCRSNIQTRDLETGWCYKNGGQPIWGYQSVRLERGEIKKGRPLVKSIWMPDDTVVAGRPVSDWARYCLVEMAMNGASLDEIRDYLNENGVPAPRQQYWGSTTVHSILQTHCILEYAGYGVWNVRGKHQRHNPSSEWVVVPNAHPALISEEEAQRIIEIRAARPKATPQVAGAKARSKGSRFALSGGLFKCARCGANMTGFTSTNGKGRRGDYYVCGSAQYRRSLGCGPGVFVDKQLIEDTIMESVASRFDEWSDPARFAKLVNDAVSDLAQRDTTGAAENARRIEEIEAKIGNVRQAIEGGLSDVQWANTRLRDLALERDEFLSKSSPVGDVLGSIRLDQKSILAFRERFSTLVEGAPNQERRDLVRCFVDGMEIRPSAKEDKQNEPAAHEIVIDFKTMPTQFVKGLGAGVGFEPTTFGL